MKITCVDVTDSLVVTATRPNKKAGFLFEQQSNPPKSGHAVSSACRSSVKLGVHSLLSRARDVSANKILVMVFDRQERAGKKFFLKQRSPCRGIKGGRDYEFPHLAIAISPLDS